MTRFHALVTREFLEDLLALRPYHNAGGLDLRLIFSRSIDASRGLSVATFETDGHDEFDDRFCSLSIQKTIATLHGAPALEFSMELSLKPEDEIHRSELQ